AKVEPLQLSVTMPSLLAAAASSLSAALISWAVDAPPPAIMNAAASPIRKRRAIVWAIVAYPLAPRHARRDRKMFPLHSIPNARRRHSAQQRSYLIISVAPSP